MSDVVSTSATTDPITLADAKRQLNVSSTADDTLIGDLITAATEWVRNRASKALITETHTLKMQTFEDARYVHWAGSGGTQQRTIFLPTYPLATVSSITYVDSAGTTQTLGSSAYITSTGDMPGRISESYNETWPDTRNVADDVTITYTAGYGSTQSAVPSKDKHAVRLLVGHYYRNRESVLTGTISKELEQGVESLLGHGVLEHYG